MSPTPSICSPLIASTPHIDHKRIDTPPSSTLRGGAGLENGMEAFPPKQSIQDRTSELSKALRDNSSVPSELSFNGAAERKSYFSSAEHRQAVVFGPSDLITIDFCYGYFGFWPTPVLQLPGGISFDLMRYWNGQRVLFVCYERKKGQSADDQGLLCGTVFWVVCIEPYYYK